MFRRREDFKETEVIHLICKECNGKGEVEEDFWNDGKRIEILTCRKCMGYGIIHELLTEREEGDGDGEDNKEEDVDVIVTMGPCIFEDDDDEEYEGQEEDEQEQEENNRYTFVRIIDNLNNLKTIIDFVKKDVEELGVRLEYLKGENE